MQAADIFSMFMLAFSLLQNISGTVVSLVNKATFDRLQIFHMPMQGWGGGGRCGNGYSSTCAMRILAGYSALNLRK